MEKIILLANDPGGFDVVYPVFLELRRRLDIPINIFLTGQAGNMKDEFRIDDNEVLEYLHKCIDNREKFILVTGTSWNSSVELEAISICKKNLIKTISILDYWSNYKARFLLKENYVFPDFLFVMDELAFDEAKKDGIDPSLMRIVGTPGLDKYFKYGMKKKKVLFLSQPLSAMPVNSNDGFNEYDAFEGVIKACDELGVDSFIKFHPKETENMKKLYSSKKVDGKLEDLIFDYDVIVGMNTMGLLHCLLMGVPVISYQPNLRTEDKCIVDKLGIIKGAFSYNQLVSQLNLYVSELDKEKFPFWFDGKSTERCVNEILSISC